MSKFSKSRLKEIDDRYVTTRWGHYEILSPDTQLTKTVLTKVKKLVIEPEKCISLQYHRHRSEIWKVIEGDGILLTEGYRIIRKGDYIAIPPMQLHKVWGGKEGIEILETWVGDYLGEDDIERVGM